MENLIPLSSVENFLYGLKDTENSKVYLKVEEKNGLYYLCVYLDNKYPNNPELNGCKLHYRMEMNKIGK